MAITDKPHWLRVCAPRGIECGKVSRETKSIDGFAVVTRGEALGHGLWLDEKFLSQVKAAGNAREGGVKARFTHPGLSGDGLGTLLGRAVNFRKRGMKVFADLNLLESASNSPRGDLASYVLDLAEEAPDLFGASIVFDMDAKEFQKFKAEHSDGNGRFQSPDPDNKSNLAHARLSALHAADIVDSPAANPEGFFSAFAPGSELAARAESILAFAFGLTEDAPPELEGEPHPERVRAFVREFLERRGLALRSFQAKPEIENLTARVAALEARIPEDCKAFMKAGRLIGSLSSEIELMKRRLR